MKKRIADLHLHSIRSDGSWTEEELLAELRKRGITVFSLTDHDTIAGIARMEGIVPQDMRFIRGIEFSAVSPAGKCHILGYGYDPSSPEFLAAIEEGRHLREEKFRKRLNHLKEWHDIELSEEELRKLSELTTVGKPHLARILMDRDLAGTVQEAIEQYIDDHGGKDSGDARISAGTAISAIIAAGGIPVWAHPLGGEGERHLAEDEFREQLETLCRFGLKGLECFYSRYTEAEERFLLKNAQERGLYVSGGSDCHGTNKNIAPGEERADKMPADPALLTILEKL